MEEDIEDIDKFEGANDNLFTVFKLNGEDYGIPVDVTDEIIKDIELFNIPGSSEYVLGAAHIRGEVIPVVNLKKCMGIGNTTEWNEVLLVENDDNKFALPVDNLENMVTPKEENIVDPDKITNLKDKQIKWLIRM
ncbi:MAG: chemotaxis protein CheW, partial [Thermoplasmatota archaeon]